jgi:outer membrane lipoprotein-sorting protein
VSNGKETVSGVNCFVVSVIPTKEQDLILAKCWINANQKYILKTQITTKSGGTLTSEYFYLTNKNYALPDKMVFNIDLNKFKLPKMISVDINAKKKTTADASNKTTGIITFNMSGYQINKGVKDEEFMTK